MKHATCQDFADAHPCWMFSVSGCTIAMVYHLDCVAAEVGNDLNGKPVLLKRPCWMMTAENIDGTVLAVLSSGQNDGWAELCRQVERHDGGSK